MNRKIRWQEKRQGVKRAAWGDTWQTGMAIFYRWQQACGVVGTLRVTLLEPFLLRGAVWRKGGKMSKFRLVIFTHCWTQLYRPIECHLIHLINHYKCNKKTVQNCTPDACTGFMCTSACHKDASVSPLNLFQIDETSETILASNNQSCIFSQPNDIAQ